MLSTYDLEASILIAATFLGYGFVAYAAVAIRKTLAGSVYRKQALGLALIGILYAVNSATSYYYFTPFDIYSLIGFVSFPLAFVTIFYWVDTSVLAARLTDPLLRDTLHWSRLRFVIWAIIVSAIVISISYGTYLFSTGEITPSAPLWLLAAYVTPAYVSVGSGVIALLIAVRRTADRTLRRHLEWFGFYLVFIFVLGGVIGNGLAVYSVEFSNIVGGAANATAAFFLYKSARSLIPLYRFSEEGASQTREVAMSTSARRDDAGGPGGIRTHGL